MDQTKTTTTAATKNIVQTAAAADHFKTFSAAVKAAGLTDTLAARGPFTVFAPTDEAFRKLAPGALEALLQDAAKVKSVLNFHLIQGYLLARDMTAGDVMTVQGGMVKIAVSGTDVRINDAHVTHANAIATNGVIHAIDEVILPKNWRLTALAA